MILILALCSVKYSLVFGRIEVFDILLLLPPSVKMQESEKLPPVHWMLLKVPSFLTASHKTTKFFYGTSNTFFPPSFIVLWFCVCVWFHWNPNSGSSLCGTGLQNHFKTTLKPGQHNGHHKTDCILWSSWKILRYCGDYDTKPAQWS